MKHSRTFFALAALAAAAAEVPACSPAEYAYRYDTLETGAIRLVRTYNMAGPTNPMIRVDTLGVYHSADLQAGLRSALRDSALVFIGRFDSLWTDSTPPPPPVVAFDTSMFSRPYTAHLRLQVDTVLRGVFPHPRPVWIRVKEGAASCTIPFQFYLNRRFLNAAAGFSVRSHLKMTFSPFGEYYWPYPAAFWFSGRYLNDPAFPGIMRLDITKILTDYPATGIAPRRLPFAPRKPSAKTWLPNGRAAGGLDARKHPVPVLR